MRRQKNIFQLKDKKILYKEMKVSNLPDKEYKVMVIRMIKKLGRRMKKHN